MVQTRLFCSLALVMTDGVAGAFQAASFVNSAAPSVASSVGDSAPSSVHAAHRQAVLSGYYQKSHTVLFAKKKRGAAAVKGGKVQVKMLKFVEGTGRVGDIVSVSPAFWENKLKKTGSAVMITDEEVIEEKKEAATVAQESLDHANHLKDKIEEMGAIIMSKKAGPDGHLFGGINKKNILSELQSKFPKGALDGKAYKVLDIRDQSGAVVDHDIKELGDYDVDVSLHADVHAKLKLSVSSE